MVKKRKPTSQAPPTAASAGGWLPFASLDLGPLPEGPATQPGNAPRQERLLLRREKAGRAGKTVIVVSGFDAGRSVAFLEDYAARLRRACGCGGTIRGREIELQGDQATGARALLEAEGHRVVGP